MNKILGTLFVLAMVTVLVLGTVSLALADPDSQRWYLSDVDFGGGVEYMYKNDETQSEGTKGLAESVGCWWMANEPATCNVTFPASTAGDPWVIQITCAPAPADGNKFRTSFGYFDGESFYGDDDCKNSFLFTGDGTTTVFTHNIEDGVSFTVPKDDWLAFGTYNTDDTYGTVTVKVGGSFSYIQSPTADPGYPVPELPTIILFSIGLLVLAGYICLRRHK